MTNSPKVPPTDEQLLEVLETYEEHGCSKRSTARALKMPYITLHRWLGYAAKRGLTETEPVMPGFEISKVSTTQDADGNTTQTSIQQRPERGEEYELPEGFQVNGVSALLDADGRLIQKWVKTKEDLNSTILIDVILNAFENYRGTAQLVTPPEFCSDELLTIYPIADHHLGMFSWARETGNDYDLKIAEQLLLDTMGKLVAQSPLSKTAIILNVGDFFHVDSSLNRTERSGHPQDVDTRYSKVLQSGVQLMITCIELALAKHEHVIVRNLPGNHDNQSALALSVALAAFFHREPRVNVDTDPSKHFFHLFGRVMIAATHGDTIKPERMAGWVAGAQPEMWGQARFRYSYAGHIHHMTKRVSENDGMTTETFNTLAAKDAYSAGAGYVANRSMVAITMHREYGESFRQTVTIPPMERT